MRKNREAGTRGDEMTRTTMIGTGARWLAAAFFIATAAWAGAGVRWHELHVMLVVEVHVAVPALVWPLPWQYRFEHTAVVVL